MGYCHVPVNAKIVPANPTAALWLLVLPLFDEIGVAVAYR